jgi:hypothetical protein
VSFVVEELTLRDIKKLIAPLKMSFALDHLGIAVRSLADAKVLYEKLGLALSPEEVVPGENVRVVMVPVGETRLELLEPTSADSVIAKFIAKFAVQKLKAEGTRLVSDEIKTGAGGHRYIFLHPSSTSGVLIELVEASH